jgi:hypothetical protein
MLAVGRIDLVPRELELLGLESVGDEGAPLLQTFEIAAEYAVRGRRIARFASRFGQRGPERCELVGVGLQKERTSSIERIEVAFEESTCQFVIERAMRKL